MLRQLVTKRFFTRSAPKQGGGHGHVHYTFDENSFTKRGVGIGLTVLVGSAVGITVGNAKFQNYKHGFPVEEEED